MGAMCVILALVLIPAVTMTLLLGTMCRIYAEIERLWH